MMFLPRAVKVYVATAPCNLRRSFDGLSNEVREALGQDLPPLTDLDPFVKRRAIGALVGCGGAPATFSERFVART